MSSDFWNHLNTGLLLAIFEAVRIFGFNQVLRKNAFGWIFVIARLPVYVFVCVVAGLWPILIPVVIWAYSDIASCVQWLKVWSNPEPF